MIILGPASLLAAVIVQALEDLEYDGALIRDYTGTPPEQPTMEPQLRGVLMQWDGDRWVGDQAAWQEGRAEVLSMLPEQGEIYRLLDALLSPGVGLRQGVEPKAVVAGSSQWRVPGAAAQTLRQLIRRLRVDIGAFEGGFWTLQEGRYRLKAEGWKDACLEEGVGPCSYKRGVMEGAEPGTTEAWTPEDGPMWLEACIQESDLRASHLPINIDPDARPEQHEWLIDLWVPAPAGSEYTLTQLSVWRRLR